MTALQLHFIIFIHIQCFAVFCTGWENVHQISGIFWDYVFTFDHSRLNDFGSSEYFH